MHAVIVPEMRFVSAFGDQEAHGMIHQVARSASTLSQQKIVDAAPELRVRAAGAGASRRAMQQQQQASQQQAC